MLPRQQGLYNPNNEKDACGVGLLANINGIKSHQLVEKGLQVLENMVHRGAEGADSKTGDGAGIMVQIPHEFILLQGIAVPEKGRYGSGLMFLPKNDDSQQLILDILERLVCNACHGVRHAFNLNGCRYDDIAVLNKFRSLNRSLFRVFIHCNIQRLNRQDSAKSAPRNCCLI